MKKLLCLIVPLAIALSVPSAANAQARQVICLPGTNPNTGNNTCYDVNASNPLPVTSSGSGTGNVNITQVGGNAVTNTVPVSGTVTAGNPVGITPTDGTITSATGSSQTVFALNASRHGLIIQNTGNANCGVNPTGGTAVIGGVATLTLFPGGSYQPRIPTLSAVTAICTSGQPLYAEQN